MERLRDSLGIRLLSNNKQEMEGKCRRLGETVPQNSTTNIIAFRLSCKVLHHHKRLTIPCGRRSKAESNHKNSTISDITRNLTRRNIEKHKLSLNNWQMLFNRSLQERNSKRKNLPKF
jgi:hypothetical protein